MRSLVVPTKSCEVLREHGPLSTVVSDRVRVTERRTVRHERPYSGSGSLSISPSFVVFGLPPAPRPPFTPLVCPSLLFKMKNRKSSLCPPDRTQVREVGVGGGQVTKTLGCGLRSGSRWRVCAVPCHGRGETWCQGVLRILGSLSGTSALVYWT